MIKKGILLLFLFSFLTTYGQDYFRISADFTVKIKNKDGSLNLTKGKVYYDKNFKELIYNITFPEVEKWVMKDTTLTIIKKDKSQKITNIPAINEFTIFHLALNVSLNEFGLNNSVYKMVKVEKKKDLVLSYWKIPDSTIENMDHIIVAKKNNTLVSVVIVGENQKIISRQFFKDYEKIGAFQFPRRVIHISIDDLNQESLQVFEFSNIKVNDLNNNNYRH